MSAGAVFQEALRVLNHLEPPEVAQRDFLRCLEAIRRTDPSPLLYALGKHAGLEREPHLRRAAAVLLGFAAGNLADDLSDGDCDYLEMPARHGPAVIFGLLNAAHSAASSPQAKVSHADLSQAARCLAKAAGPQQLELRTAVFDAVTFKSIAEGIAGLQWQAWLSILWSGTPLADKAMGLGRDLGVAGHTARDIATLDRRFFSMSEPEQAEIQAWAREAGARVKSSTVAPLAEAITNVWSALETTPERPQAIVARYYDEKVERTLERYGPGPRVHYHSGLFAPGEENVPATREAMVAAQERLLERLQPWVPAGARLLDVGCGLGGGSLFWAQAHGATVHALTLSPRQAEVGARFSQQVGAADRVTFEVRDVMTLPESTPWDAAVAIESACYLPRAAWARLMFDRLRPNGRLVVADCFVEDAALRPAFDAYWKTASGSLAEYRRMGSLAGLQEIAVLEWSADAARYWELSLAKVRDEHAQAKDAEARARLERSVEEHGRLARAMRDGRFRYAAVVWEKPAPRS